MKALRLTTSLLLLLLSPRLTAATLYNFYGNDCQVATGIILRVTPTQVKILKTTGSIVTFAHHEILAIARYQINQLAMGQVMIPEDIAPVIPFYVFTTLRDNEFVELARGWPVEFTKENILVLTAKGDDYLLNRNDIWALGKEQAPLTLDFTKENHQSFPGYRLRNPLSFEHCPSPTFGTHLAKVDLRPEQSFDDPIAIKKLLDEKRQDMQVLDDYDDHQRFYAVPQKYLNRTLLGTWFIFGSRYAHAGARKVNLLPFVRDELSDGPFSYQRVIASGVSVIDWTLHEEPVLNSYFALKADYIQLALFVDPLSMLIGKKYAWKQGQLESEDDRVIEKGGIQVGLDIKYFSLMFALTSFNFGVRIDDDFIGAENGFERFGLSFQRKNLKTEFYLGRITVKEIYTLPEEEDATAEANLNYQFWRLNVQYKWGADWDLQSVYINRKLNVGELSDLGFAYQSNTNAFSEQISWNYNYRWSLTARFMLEAKKIETQKQSEATQDDQHLYPKIATGFTVAF